MNIQEYLKQCSVKSVDELTDEQVVDHSAQTVPLVSLK